MITLSLRVSPWRSVTRSARGVKITAFRWAAGSVCKLKGKRASVRYSEPPLNIPPGSALDRQLKQAVLLAQCLRLLYPFPAMTTDLPMGQTGDEGRVRRACRLTVCHRPNAGAGKPIMIIALRLLVCGSTLKANRSRSVSAFIF